MANTLDLCKNAASIAVDSVFNNVLAKLSGNSNLLSPNKMLHLDDSSNSQNNQSQKLSNKQSPKYNPLHGML